MTPDIAWPVPIILPLIIGVLVGFIVKHTIKLVPAVVALIFLLILFGAVSFTFQDIYFQAFKLLPRIIQTGSVFFDMLPYSSITFVLGLVLGLWRG